MSPVDGILSKNEEENTQFLRTPLKKQIQLRKFAARWQKSTQTRHNRRNCVHQFYHPIHNLLRLLPLRTLLLPMTNQELKALRLSLRMNQKDFADDFGVSLRTLQAYESGLTPIPEARIRAYQAAHPQTDTTAAPSPNQQTEEAEKLLPFDTFLPSTEHPADSTAAEIALLRERVTRLQQLVDEKERTIQILLRQLPPL